MVPKPHRLSLHDQKIPVALRLIHRVMERTLPPFPDFIAEFSPLLPGAPGGPRPLMALGKLAADAAERGGHLLGYLALHSQRLEFFSTWL